MRSFALTKLQYYADFFVVPAFVLMVLSICIMAWGPDLLLPVGAGIGFVLWTMSEYVIHRFIFHRSYRRHHWTHHRSPVANIGVPASITLLIMFVGYLVLVSIFGGIIGTGLLAGYALGYLIYIVGHHAMHRWKIDQCDWLYPAKQRHLYHHLGNEVNFSIVFPFWDRVFGTYVQP